MQKLSSTYVLAIASFYVVVNVILPHLIFAFFYSSSFRLCYSPSPLLDAVDREEILTTSQRLLRMLNTVTVVVTTVRNKEQQLALEAVNALLANLSRMSDASNERENARQLCRLYLNTCSSESYCLPVDDKFQRVLIECTADDQKRTRKRLETLLGNIGQQSSKSNGGGVK